eukprot:124962-Prorocentrum_minimum.AAC.1
MTPWLYTPAPPPYAHWLAWVGALVQRAMSAPWVASDVSKGSERPPPPTPLKVLPRALKVHIAGSQRVQR